MSHSIPFVDEHAVDVCATGTAVWTALWRTVAAGFSTRHAELLARVLRCDETGDPTPAAPAVGAAVADFTVVEADDARVLALAGAHRFSRYRLTFRLDERDDGRTRVRAETRARFVGATGWLYGRLVIGTHLHALVVRHLLNETKRRSERLSEESQKGAR